MSERYTPLCLVAIWLRQPARGTSICFTSHVAIRTFASVRPLLLSFLILCGGAVLASAQVQEKKLLDRLLKPDMTLQNNMQGRQFAATAASITKKAPTKSFYTGAGRSEKGFWNTRQVSVKEFKTGRSQYGRRAATLSTRGQIEKLDAPYSTPAYDGVRESSDAQKAIPASGFAGNRKFEAQGKSQKFLSAQDRPLTIDQVRELLNKNK